MSKGWLSVGMMVAMAGCGSPMGSGTDAGDSGGGNDAGDAGAMTDAGGGVDAHGDVVRMDVQGSTDASNGNSDGAPPDNASFMIVRDFPDPTPEHSVRPSSMDGTYGTNPTTFVLPDRPGGDNGIIAADLATRYPQLATVDRLYIPAGHYAYVYLGGLPMRSADHPLVITNQGGQVLMDGGMAVDGGANWVLTGRYDPVSLTGDVGFQGHKNGRYAHSSGTYGFYAHGNDTGGGCGYSIGGRATDFEVEFIEADHMGYCGTKIKTDNDPTATMRNVRFHDAYMHDTQGEGLYFGNTGDVENQHRLENFAIYNNRILRTGYETSQFEQIGEGTEIFHNVFGFGALNWLNPWSRNTSQDNAFQLGPRTGRLHLHNNVIFGGGETLLVTIFGHAAAEPDNADLVVENNYFSNGKDYAVYLGRGAAPSNSTFTDNLFRDLRFSYWQRREGLVDPVTALIARGTSIPLTLTGTYYDTLMNLSFDYTGENGAGNGVTGTGNVFTDSLPPIEFMALGFPEGWRYQDLEGWRSTGNYNVLVNGGAEVPIPYTAGMLVVWNGVLYRALVDNQQLQPDQHPEAWAVVPGMLDDVRLNPGSPYRGVGLLDQIQ